jgi:hypothetical protein
MQLLRIGILSVAILFPWCPPLVAQSVSVAPARPLGLGLADRPWVEPHLAADPRNPMRLVGAAMVGTTEQAGDPQEFARIGQNRTCVTFQSADGGQSWSLTEFKLSSCFDPWVVITRDGHSALSVLASHSSFPSQRGPLLVFHSADAGQTWDSIPTSLGVGHDHETMAVDLVSPGRANWVYLVSSREIHAERGQEYRGIFVSRSRDGGRTFDSPSHVVPNNLYNNTETAAVLSDGSLAVPFLDIARSGPAGLANLQYRRPGSSARRMAEPRSRDPCSLPRRAARHRRLA